ncbi:MAG: amidohydrolase family protein [Chloroflexota bacterium]
MKKIAIEEHFVVQEILDFMRASKTFPKMVTVKDEKGQTKEEMWYTPEIKATFSAEIGGKLLDLGEGRLKEMDDAGIDMQVLCLSSGVDAFTPADGTMLARKANDSCAAAIKKHPDRFAAFATIAPQDPLNAAKELERAVKELGFKGTKLNSNVQGKYLDEPEFGPVLAMAEKLGVPIYLHPKSPSAAMIKPFMAYKPLTGSMWGYAAEAGLHSMRLILGGVFDKYPGLKIILGHLGEALPFWMWRLDNRWSKEKLNPDPSLPKLAKNPTDYIKQNFMVTTSGMFWEPVLKYVCQVLGVERVLFAVDHPYEQNKVAADFIEKVDLPAADKEKICHLNVEKLLKL